MSKAVGKYIRLVLLMAGVIVIIALFMTAKVRDTRSDPFGHLLIAQSIIEHGTIKLDAYYGVCFDKHNTLRFINGHVYSAYPVGTPLFSVPFVWVTTLLGYDMCYDEDRMQAVISAIIASVVFVLIYRIASMYVSPISSFVITLVSFLGSSLTSSMGTALWSHNFTALFEVLTLLLISLHETGRRRLNPYATGTLLFAAYMCRPTASIFIVVVFAFLFIRNRRLFAKTAGTAFVLLVMFMTFNYLEFGTLLTEYYHLPPRFNFLEGIYGILLSPGRGILIFSPFLIPVLAGVVYYFKRLKTESVFWLWLVWSVLHILTMSISPSWNGGWCYGARLLTNVTPAIILISVLVWREAKKLKPKALIPVVCVYLMLGAAGIFINAWQGLYNGYIQMWNSLPNINENRHFLFDWRYPQFLASEKQILKRLTVHYFGDRDDVELAFQWIPGRGLSVVPVEKVPEHHQR